MRNERRDDTTRRAMRREGERPAPLAPARVVELRRRVSDGFYDAPRVADTVARRILAARDV